MTTGGGWSHIDERGEARMVDVGDKDVTRREARARARVRMRAATREAIIAGKVPKGAVLAVARIAGIQGAKQTSVLVPLCHPIPLDAVGVEFSWEEVPQAGEACLVIETSARATARTGVEMEALAAAAAAALAVYDMCKAVDRAMAIEDIVLLEKRGGRSGHWVRGD